MDGKEKEAAARSMITGLYECGYINDKEKRTLLYRLQVGEREVFERIREYLLKICEEITR